MTRRRRRPSSTPSPSCVAPAAARRPRPRPCAPGTPRCRCRSTVGRNTNRSCALSSVPNSVTYIVRFTTLAGDALRHGAERRGPAPMTGSTQAEREREVRLAVGLLAVRASSRRPTSTSSSAVASGFSCDDVPGAERPLADQRPRWRSARRRVDRDGDQQRADHGGRDAAQERGQRGPVARPAGCPPACRCGSPVRWRWRRGAARAPIRPPPGSSSRLAPPPTLPSGTAPAAAAFARAGLEGGPLALVLGLAPLLGRLPLRRHGGRRYAPLRLAHEGGQGVVPAPLPRRLLA